MTEQKCGTCGQDLSNEGMFHSCAGEAEDQKFEYLKVRFCDNRPEFTGTDLEKYGPFEKGETAEIPKDHAEVLIARGNAEEVEEGTVDDSFDFESATGIAPAVEVVEWVEDSDPAQPRKIRLHHNGTEFGTFVKEGEER